MNSKKVVIYGVACIELRQDIEFFLDDEYEILGYSDAYFTVSGKEGVPFIELNQLCKQDFDYIVLASYCEETWINMRQSLVKHNIPEEKIVEPIIFVQKNAEKARFDIITDIQNNYKGGYGLIFGLSYSRFGIRKEELLKNFYDCSLPGLDLYYNFRIYMYILEHKLLLNTKMALLVFPYYYFNFDMSRSLAQYKSGQIFGVLQLDDWHNHQQVEGGTNYVKNYKLFGKKIAKIYCSHCFDIEKSTVYEGAQGMATLEKIWFAEYENTIIENQKLFIEFCQKLKTEGIEPIVVVPPIYLRGINPLSKKSFEKKKKQFYNIIRAAEKMVGDVKIYDYADKFADEVECFRDLTHLNIKGGKKFTELLNKEILL